MIDFLKEEDMNKKAFTLIELLVTIVVIGMLLSLLLPALGMVREKGRRFLCMNNLRQHGVAWYLYLNDHGQRFHPFVSLEPPYILYPVTFGGKIGTYFTGGWERDWCAKYRVLNPYVDVDVSGPLENWPDVENDPNLELFRCPDDKKPSQEGETIFDYYGCSYWLNPLIRGIILSSITTPTDELYLERDHIEIIPGHGGKGYLSGGNTPVMVLFLDGHAGGPFLEGDLLSNPNPNP